MPNFVTGQPKKPGGIDADKNGPDLQDQKLHGQGSQRLDKWLWYSRLVKTRSLAAKLVSGGKIRVNGLKSDKPATSLRCGDVITAKMGTDVRVLEVLAPGRRRGPATEAQALYEDLAPLADQAAKKKHKDDLGITVAGQRDAGSGRPTKRDRRLLDRLRPRSG